MPPKKKPAKARNTPKKAAKKPEKATPKEKEPEVAEEEEEEEDQVVKPAMVAVKKEQFSPKKLAKAKAKASPKKKGEKPEKGLPAPNKNAWVDVRNQVNSLAKKGKPKLREQFNAAKEKGTQGKREFYYNVFLLDPDVAKKSIHKSSQQVTSTKSSLAKGWMTVSQHAIMLGVDRQDPDFKQLAEAACEGLPIRDHTKPWPNLEWSKCMLRSGCWMKTQMKGGAPQKPVKGCRMKIWLLSSLSMWKMLWRWHLKPSSSCWVAKVLSLQRLMLLFRTKKRKSLKRLRMVTKGTMAGSQGVWLPMGTR